MLSRVLRGGMIVAVALVGIAVAAEQSATFRGTVFRSKSSSGVEVVTLATPAGTYTIVMDDRGTKLAKDMAGKKAEVIGIVTRDGSTSLLRVQSFSPILTGRIEAVKNQQGGVMIVRLVTPDGTYEIPLDDKGIELGKKWDGQTVDAVGTVSKKKFLFIGKNEFTVKSFERHKEAG